MSSTTPSPPISPATTPRREESRPEEALRWVARPVLARLLRAGIAMAPVVLAVAATYLAAAFLPEPSGAAATAVWFGSLLVLSMIVMAVVERMARLLLPLTLLLRLTLVFPDEAPSRFALALRTSSTKELERTVAEVKDRGLGGTEAEAAENLLVLVAALSDHDRMTRGHSERVRAYSELIGEELELSDTDRSKLRWAGLLHDVGKLYVPEEILNKPDRLTDDEFEIIKKHPEWGAELVAPLADWLGPWADAVGQHHERWDGKGYPNGLAGTEISLAARIVSVADVFDVITSVRSYKGATSATAARVEISNCAGTQFDPAVVRAFLNVGIGRVRRTMWPLTMLAQIPQLLGVLTAPVAGPAVSATLAAAAVTTGAIVSPAIDATLHREEPAALALVVDDRFDGLLDLGDKEIVVTTSEPATTIPASTRPETTAIPETTAFPETTAIPETTTGPQSTAGPETTRVPTTAAGSPPTTQAASPPTTRPSSTTTEPTAGRPVAPDSDAVGDGESAAAPPVTAPVPSSGRACAEADPRRAGECTLTGADLSGLDLSKVDLRGADLTGANLAGTDLEKADLRGANLAGTNLAGAEFAKADLRGANLAGANLAGADFDDAKLNDAVLINTNLGGTNLHRADLRAADLTGAGGLPSSWQRAQFDATICPSGLEQSTACW